MQMDWQGKHYAFYTNRACEFFPCHPGADPQNFNCLFCYCPLYPLGSGCGGNFIMLPNGTKDCSQCMFPHLPQNYGTVLARCAKVTELTKQLSK
ncbi:MAG: cysteine-rich small domain-containing protein [Faecalibacterium sp.]|nr:cysteine-rich small domain-containing protein [Faecalibacterium sp.]